MPPRSLAWPPQLSVVVATSCAVGPHWLAPPEKSLNWQRNTHTPFLEGYYLRESPEELGRWDPVFAFPLVAEGKFDYNSDRWWRWQDGDNKAKCIEASLWSVCMCQCECCRGLRVLWDHNTLKSLVCSDRNLWKSNSGKSPTEMQCKKWVCVLVCVCKFGLNLYICVFISCVLIKSRSHSEVNLSSLFYFHAFMHHYTYLHMTSNILWWFNVYMYLNTTIS